MEKPGETPSQQKTSFRMLACWKEDPHCFQPHRLSGAEEDAVAGPGVPGFPSGCIDATRPQLQLSRLLHHARQQVEIERECTTTWTNLPPAAEGAEAADDDWKASLQICPWGSTTENVTTDEMPSFWTRSRPCRSRNALVS